MATIKVRVQGEIATNLTPEVKLVCQNDKYDVEFEFDESWANSNFKTALFIYNGKSVPITFDREQNRNVCKIPALYDTELLHIGVKSDDIGGVHTTTPARVGCLLSANDIANGEIPNPTPSQYDEIIALLNKYISGGGGGSSVGGLTEEQVREIVAQETLDLQPKTDESLPTESKEVVGAIKELYEREDKQGLTEEQVKAVVRETAVTQETDPTVPDWAKQAKKPTYSYNEITDKPALFSGDYNDLSNKPTIPSTEGLATVEQLENLTNKTDELEEYSIREVSLVMLEDNELSVELKDKEGKVIASAETTLPMPDRNQFVKDGIVENDIPLTDDEKASACDWLGAMPKPTTNPMGVALLQVVFNPISGSITYSYATVGLNSGNVATYQSNATDMSLMYGNGTTLYVDTPKGKKQAANKEYVDDLVGDIESVLTAILGV